MLRDQIADSIKQAQKGQDKKRVATLRLVHAAIVDRDIALRGKGKDRADDEEVLDILAKMVKQREESAQLYEKGGRKDLVEQEQTEIEIIKEFLPEQITDDELDGVVGGLIAETDAQSLRDMGKVMALLKERYRGRIDMGKAGAILKSRLTG